MMNMKTLNQLAALIDPDGTEAYIETIARNANRIRIGNTVSYRREAYSFQNGLVTSLDEPTNRALVCWTDSMGITHERLVGVEFLARQPRKRKTPTPMGMSASSS